MFIRETTGSKTQAYLISGANENIGNGKIKEISLKEKGNLNPKTLNQNLNAMENFYVEDKKSGFTDIHGGEKISEEPFVMKGTQQDLTNGLRNSGFSENQIKEIFGNKSYPSDTMLEVVDMPRRFEAWSTGNIDLPKQKTKVEFDERNEKITMRLWKNKLEKTGLGAKEIDNLLNGYKKIFENEPDHIKFENELTLKNYSPHELAGYLIRINKKDEELKK